MVNDYIFLPVCTQCIIAACTMNHTRILVTVPHTETHVSDDHIVAIDFNRLISDADSIAAAEATL